MELLVPRCYPFPLRQHVRRYNHVLRNMNMFYTCSRGFPFFDKAYIQVELEPYRKARYWQAYKDQWQDVDHLALVSLLP